MSVKIVHAADFHLDSAFGALSAEQAREIREYFEGEYPRRERLPVQKELLKALKDRAAG